MRRRACGIACLVVLAGFVSGAGLAQTGASEGKAGRNGSGPAATALATLSATRAVGPVVLDGRLADEAWLTANVAHDLTQREPDEGRPATERTEIRVIYDDDALYVGARLFDREPARIVRRLARRDDDPQSDKIVVLLDPHHDHQTGFSFTVGAGGSLADALLYNDNSEDDSWDGVWDAVVEADGEGWTAEIRIPFSQLRFASGDRQTWGFNVVRYIQRRNEESWWELVPKKETRLVSRLGHLTNLDGIRSRSHIDVLPYVSSGVELIQPAGAADPFNDGSRLLAGAGLDLKWGLASNMTLDAAVNPDFGQVEVDPAVVNLTAFETFYPEKRPFFLEGADLYRNFGRNGLLLYGRFGAQYPSLYYSRRVGRTPQGPTDGDFVDQPEATTILGAAKLTGRTSSGWSLAVLNALTGREVAKVAAGQDRHDIEVEPLTNYFAARIRRDLAQRGGFGFIGTSVERQLRTAGLSSRLPNRAYAFGTDGHLFLDDRRTWVASGSVAGTWVAGDPAAMLRLQRSSARYFQRPDAGHVEISPEARSLAGWSGEINVNRTTGNLLIDGAAWAVSPGFESNDFGYSPATDRLGAHGGLILRKTRPDRVTRSRELTVLKYYTWNFEGDVVADATLLQGEMTFHNYWSVYAGVHYQPRVIDDRLTRGGPVARRLAYGQVDASVATDQRKAISLRVWGGYGTNRQGGWSGNGEVSVRVKPAPSLTVDVGPSLYRGHTIAQYVRSVTDATATATYGGRYVFGDLDQTELSMPVRVNWTLSPRMTLQVYAQPLIAIGDYTGFKELARPRTFDFTRYGADAGTIEYDPVRSAYSVDPDGDGPAATFGFGSPDFNFKSVRLNAVFRWEWRLGSTLYAVWTQQREDDTAPGELSLGRDVRALFGAPSDNVFMVKVAYWFSR